MTQQPVDEGAGVIWVRTEPDSSGTYRLKLEIDEDHGQFLDVDQARAWAEYVLHQAVLAHYDALVFRQLTHSTNDPRAAGDVIQELRKDRADYSNPNLSVQRLRLRPGVNIKGKPFLTVVIDGQDKGQWDYEQAQTHAVRILEGCQRADLDEQYRRTLVGLVGLDDATARRAVMGLSSHDDD